MKQSFLKNWLPAIIVTSALLLGGCGKSESPTETARPVVLATASSPATLTHHTFSGIAESAVSSTLSFRVSGEILQLPVKLGDIVAEGELIAQLDPVDFELKVSQARAALAQAEAQLTQAEGEYNRIRPLYEKSTISKRELDNAEAAFDSAKAQVETAQKQLELASRQLTFTALKAPQAGSIDSIPVEVFQVVQAGQTIVRLISPDDIEITIGVPEALINAVSQGQMGKVAFESLPGKAIEAEVTEVAVSISRSSTYEVKLSLMDNNQQVRPGMVCDVELAFEGRVPFITIPPEAVVGRLEDQYIWIYEQAKGTVTRRPVQVGKITTEGVQILDGLTPGESYVVRGAHRVQEGISVKPVASGNSNNSIMGSGQPVGGDEA